jgi:hypothetical protein
MTAIEALLAAAGDEKAPLSSISKMIRLRGARAIPPASQKSGSQLTRRWREMDSNPRSPRETLFEAAGFSMQPPMWRLPSAMLDVSINRRYDGSVAAVRRGIPMGE